DQRQQLHREGGVGVGEPGERVHRDVRLERFLCNASGTRGDHLNVARVLADDGRGRRPAVTAFRGMADAGGAPEQFFGMVWRPSWALDPQNGSLDPFLRQSVGVARSRAVTRPCRPEDPTRLGTVLERTHVAFGTVAGGPGASAPRRDAL